MASRLQQRVRAHAVAVAPPVLLHHLPSIIDGVGVAVGLAVLLGPNLLTGLGWCGAAGSGVLGGLGG